MWSLTKIIGLIILPLMVGSAVLGSLQTMQTESVDDQYSNMDAILEREQNSIVIDKDAMNSSDELDAFGSNAPGREMLKDVMIVSQLSALNCGKAGNIIAGYYPMAQFSSQGTETEGDTPAFALSIPDDYPELQDMANGEGEFDEIHPKYAVAGRVVGNYDPYIERVPGYAVQFTDWAPTCVGLAKAVPGEVETMLEKGLIGTAIDGSVDFVTSIPEDAYDFFTCTSTPGWTGNSGNDQEGRYGRVPFEIAENLERPIVLATKRDKPDGMRRDAVWSMHFAQPGNCYQGMALGAVTTVTAFTGGAIGGTAVGGPGTGAIVAVTAATASATATDWGDTDTKLINTLAGGQMVRYAPYHEQVISGDENWPSDLDLTRGHVVVDAPIIMHDLPNNADLRDSNVADIPSGDSHKDEEGSAFRKRASYVLCPGVEGYIQTNRESSGREGGEHTPAEDHDLGASKITTYVVVTSDEEERLSCIDQSTQDWEKINGLNYEFKHFRECEDPPAGEDNNYMDAGEFNEDWCDSA